MSIPTAKRTPPCTAGLSRLEVLLCLVVAGVLLSALVPRLAALNDAAKPARLQTAAAVARAAAGVACAPALFIGLKDPGCEFLYVQATSPDGVPEVDIVDASCH